MANKYYAVEFRFMHDARHYLSLYTRREDAANALQILVHADDHGELPYELPEPAGQIEIKFRSPPLRAEDGRYIQIVNNGRIPNVY